MQMNVKQSMLYLRLLNIYIWMTFLHLSGKMFLLENNTIDTGEVDVGRRVIQDVPPGKIPHTLHKIHIWGSFVHTEEDLRIEFHC